MEEENKSSENGPVVTPPSPNPVLGIDFGTQKCVIALGSRSSSFLPRIVANNLSNDQTPCIVSFKGRERFIGEEALNSVVSTPKDSITNLKRLLGFRLSDGSVQSELPRQTFSLKETQERLSVEISFRNEKESFLLEEIAAMILHKLKDFASKAKTEDEGATVQDCVIAVPGSWTEKQRTAIMDAAVIAGLNVQKLLCSTTAAALCYGFTRLPKKEEKDKQSNGTAEEVKKKTVLILEMGHTYFGAEVVALENRKLEVVGSSFDDDLGGRSFDEFLFNHFAADFKSKTQCEVRNNPKAMSRLRKEAEKTKQILSTIPETQVQVECLMEDRDYRTKVSREFMEQGCRDILDRLAAHIHKAVEKASLTIPLLDSVEVIGGGMRIPGVQARVKQVIGDKELCTTLDSAHCIATGSALFAKTLNPELEFPFQVVDPFNADQDFSKMPAETIEKSKARLAALEEHDATIARAREKKNEIESFIYVMREKRKDPGLASLIQPSEKETLLKILDDSQNWIDEQEEAELGVLEEKHKELKNAIAQAAPKLHEQMVKEEEERRKIEEEEKERQKNYKPEKISRDDKEPRTKAEKIDAAKRRKHQGAVCFKDGDTEGAVLRWTQALAYFESLWDLNDEQKKEIDEIKLACYLNLSACYLKLLKYEKARDNCTEALKLDKENVKALYRRGELSNFRIYKYLFSLH